ncbi:MAG: bifunctional metallophosphatase/5'-nucleotidase [Ruminococcaceae bacterium]|nr:bifunctional metallophosphatase/5'-nucleotidase [Oscillospiraceae bacterium]
MKKLKKLVLLHSNDMHGDFLAEKVDEKLVGGVSLLSGYVNRVRQEEPNTLYCIAGDMFRGSIIDQEFQGISTIEIMNMLSPDVVTIGNHETDYGLAHLLFLEKCAKFPIINANLFIRINHTHLFQPYKILRVGGMKVLFIGILTEEVLAQTKKDGLISTFISIEDAAEEVRHICDIHRSIDVDLTVLLTHIGFEEDKKLAAAIDPACGVDIIIGGHSHTLLTEPEKINDILIVQAGMGTDQIGRFDITVDAAENRVDSWTWQTIPISEQTCPYDHDIETLITKYKHHTDEKYSRVVTRFKRRLTHPARTQETELGCVFADAMRESLGTDIFLMASGSIRTTWMGPIVMLGDLNEGFPYDDAAYVVKISGSQLRRMLLHMLRDEVWQGVHCEFYQFSEGLRAVYSKREHAFRELSFHGEPLDDDRLYTVGLQAFHFNNLADSFQMDVNEIFANARPRMVATSCRTVLEGYLSDHQRLDHRAGERLVILD